MVVIKYVKKKIVQVVGLSFYYTKKILKTATGLDRTSINQMLLLHNKERGGKVRILPPQYRHRTDE